MSIPATRNVHIRGKLGMQILESFAGLGRVIDKDEHPQHIVVNVGHGEDPSYHNRMADLFETTIPISNSNGFQKQKAWSAEAIRYAFKHRGKVCSLFRLNDVVSVRMDNIIHVRGLDKALTKPETMVDKIMENLPKGKVYILGDDPKLAGKIAVPLTLAGYEVHSSDQDDVRDWKSVYWAEQVIGVLSSFTISTLLFRPDSHMKLFGREHNDGDFKLTESEFEAVDELMKWCKNVTWI